MSRELKVSFLFILVYFIYGLTSFITLGDFVTLYLFSKLNLVLIALIFIFIHFKRTVIFYDIIALLGLVAGAFLDDFSLYYLAEKFDSFAMIDWGNKPSLIYIAFVFLYLFYGVAVYVYWRETKHWWIILCLSLLLGCSIFTLFLGEFLVWNIFLSLFFLIYFISSKILKLENNSITQSYAALFIFQISVESMKYLYV